MSRTYSLVRRAGLLTRISAPALAAGFALAANPALAQSDDVDPDVIIVTAQLREQNVQDVPLSITAVSGDLLEARSQTTLTDITAQMPNLLLQKNPAGQGNSVRVFIRGVGQSDQSPSVEPGVGTYIDDIYYGTVLGSAFDLTDIERIEVLRGPQGTLSGMNTLGGAIKIYSRKPEGSGGYVEASLGNLGRIDVKASADFTVVPDAVYARFTGVTRNRDGHVTRYDYGCLNPDDFDVISGALPSIASGGDCELGEMGNQQMYAVRGSLRIAPEGSPLEINVMGDYTKDTSETQASVLIASGESVTVGRAAGYVDRSGLSIPYQGVAYDDRFVTYGPYRRADAVLNDPYASYANFYDPGVMYSAIGAPPGPPSGYIAGEPLGPFIAPSAAGAEAWGVSATIDLELSDNLALKSITGYRHMFSETGSDNDHSPVVFIMDDSDYTHEQFSQELRLNAVLLEDKLDLVVGGFYYDASTRYNARIHTPFSGFCPADTPCFSFINDDTADLQSYAGFANVAFAVTDRLTLEGGIRVTHEKKEYLYNRLNPDGNGDYLPLSNPGNPLTGFVGVYEETITDYRAVASYNITDDAMVYAQFSTGFKGGGVAPRPYVYQQIRPFGAEKLKAYEVGFKTDLLDRALRLNGSIFHMEYEGYQGTPTTCLGLDDQPLPVTGGGIPGLCGQYLNIGDAKVRGFELETTIRPAAGLQIDGAMSLTDFEFTSINYPTTAIIVGANRPGIGEFKWSAGIQYEALLGDNIGSLTPRIDVNYTPGYCGNFDCDPNVDVDSYTLVNARLTYRSPDEDWSISLEAMNLFDKFYFLNKFATFYVNGQPGRPREVAVTVRRRF
ncbi:TonB-dependent receptor [Alteraurantiacibacter aquimixticola]|uniref:TonB-dependent receptor n=1 Tax=Alteraurantiacibacter aquimixticola TaxID=2489173 RepID=A0A4T3EYR8_9SPHN|nr:TonB-dependent receptor [Alteraurantiacibacter aquimixticola]TIX49809.1 TonB-dependent receptor [Alteraurantiacibacter aquimixticola]